MTRALIDWFSHKSRVWRRNHWIHSFEYDWGIIVNAYKYGKIVATDVFWNDSADKWTKDDVTDVIQDFSNKYSIKRVIIEWHVEHK